MREVDTIFLSFEILTLVDLNLRGISLTAMFVGWIYTATLSIWLGLHINYRDFPFSLFGLYQFPELFSGSRRFTHSIWSLMWPIYLLLNKILKTEDEREPKGDSLSVIEPYLFQKSSCNIDCQPPSLRRSLFIEVPHINQIYTWDCGLACVLMVLETIGVNNCDIQALAELCCTTSIWTVDLAYLLQRFVVTFSYFTVTFGANPNYCAESFYKEELPNDLVRVDTLFQKAMEAGIDIQCRSISGKEISILILSGKYIAIALVDHTKLSHAWQEDVHVPGVFSNNSDYTGHYVLICGFDAEADMFEIRDPASSKKHKRISSKSLEEARKAFGTDEDLLLISLQKSKNHRQPSLQLPVNMYMITVMPFRYREDKIASGDEEIERNAALVSGLFTIWHGF